MRLFRRSLDLAQASVRPATAADITRVSRLFRDAARRYQGFAGVELEPMLAETPGVVLESGTELWGVALCSWRAGQTVWLRGVALVEGLDVRAGLGALLLPLHARVRDTGVAHIFYAGDDASDSWMQPALRARGYALDTEVVVYEKRDLDVPAPGSSLVHIRPALPMDVADVTALDRVCFDDQWIKDERILGPAISHGSLFIVAELGSRIVGYAYATSHFGGRLMHLVRIAVDPAYQGRAIGVRLLAEVVASARRQGATSLTLNTQSHNLHAQRLYHWFGFVTTGERQVVLRFDLS